MKIKNLLIIFCLFIFGFFSAQGQTPIFVNEIHYDNDGSDVDEGIEIAGPAGTDLTGYKILGYNGSNGNLIPSVDVAITGIISNDGSGFGTLWVPVAGLQNGNGAGTQPDGFVFVDDFSAVIQFLSYEGSFTANNGPASGTNSEDIGVEETNTSSTPIGVSLQLIGVGDEYEDFSWTGPVTHSRGATNTDQTFCGGGTASSVFINEFHYDNTGVDANEGVEIAGPAGTNLSGYSLLFYNGGDGTVYDNVGLSGSIPNEVLSGNGSIWFPIAGIQNDMDGIALVVGGSTVLEFISYEGSFMATDGAASGTSSTDVGVSESSATTATTESLQRTGTGEAATDFSWTGPATQSQGTINADQAFCAAAPGIPTAVTNPETDVNTTSVTLNGTVNDNGASTTVFFYYGTTPGGPYGSSIAAVQSPLAPGSGESAVTAALTGLTSGTTYYYIVEATNSEGTAQGVEEEFTPVFVPNLVINEIHYNPCVTQGDDADFEYIELYNAETSTIDISSFTFNLGVTFTFPGAAGSSTTTMAAGEYILVAANSASFPGPGVQVFQYSGVLNNSGETVEIHDPSANVVDKVAYVNSDGGNGTCGSLEVVNNGLDNSDTGTNWAESTFDTGAGTYGTPGAINSNAPAFPVEFLSFSADVIQQGVTLSWVTASEINNDYFEIERSIDNENFVSLGTKSGAGTTLQPQSYQFIDPTPKQGINYYRLRQIDFDGTMHLSTTVVAEFEIAVQFSLNNVYPNPSKGVLNLPFTVPQEGTVQVKLFNTSGASVIQESVAVSSGKNTIERDLSHLPQGIYFVELKMAGQTHRAKWMKY